MKPSTGNPAPGYKKYPGHHIETKPAKQRVRVTFNGEVIADTKDAIELMESKSKSTVAPVVYYIPRKDVKMDRLVRTAHSTHCPFKGDASYWTLVLDDARHENIVWSYEEPIDSLPEIAGLLCFYDERVELVVDGEPA